MWNRACLSIASERQLLPKKMEEKLTSFSKNDFFETNCLFPSAAVSPRGWSCFSFDVRSAGQMLWILCECSQEGNTLWNSPQNAAIRQINSRFGWLYDFTSAPCFCFFLHTSDSMSLAFLSNLHHRTLFLKTTRALLFYLFSPCSFTFRVFAIICV